MFFWNSLASLMIQRYWQFDLWFLWTSRRSNQSILKKISPKCSLEGLMLKLILGSSGRGTRDQIASIHWIIEKAREFQKNIYFCFIDYAKAFDCVDHNKLWKILKEMGIPDHLTCLLRNLYAGQEAAIRTGHGTTDRFQIEKGVRQSCILSPCLFNFYVLCI